jgi:transposase InsO family protein
MPWKETHVEEERMRFVAACLDEESDWTMSELCEAFGVSRKTGYKWLERYEEFGVQGLRDQCRAPKTRPNAMAAAVVKRLLELRRRHRFWGPRKIVAWLEREEPTISWPAVSTAGEILKRHGLVGPRRRRRRAVAQGTGLSQPRQPNDQWSADFKGWFRTQDGKRCDPLTISDGFSRFLLRCRVVERPDEEHVRPVFRSTFREYGVPLVLRTDNGPPFASTAALGGLTRLSAWWVKLGIAAERIDPGEPQQNGRHERMHETLKQETARPPRANARAQQRAFDDFWYVYNFERPHQALGDTPPAQVYEASPRLYPEREPELEYPGHFEVRRVRTSGEIKWQGKFLYLSQALIGEPVGLEPISERHWRMVFGPVPLGLLDDHTGKFLAYCPRTRSRGGVA